MNTARWSDSRPDETQVQVLLRDARRRAQAYLSGLAERPVAPAAEALAALGKFDGRIPERGRRPGAVLDLLDEIGSPATMASAGPRYFGFVTGGAHPVAVAASWLLSAWDQNTALEAMSPVASHLDELALRWLVDLFGLPEGTGGGFVTGATMANATCLAAARDHVLAGAGWDAGADGLIGAPPIQVVVGEEGHATLLKALGLVGLGRRNVVRLPVDDQGAIKPERLPELHSRAIVCLQAGNVNSGASDPFTELVPWAHEHGAWVHVDGAFGLWAAASRSMRARVAGVQDTDSWATDCHKWLNTTFDSGVALVRDPDALAKTTASSASYLMPGSGHDPMHHTPQSSQRARGAECWAVLSNLGRLGVAELVERCCRLARRFADRLSAAGVEVLNDVTLNQVVVAFGDDRRTAEVVSTIQADGTCWCGTTTWRGRLAMRISVSNWSTTEEDVDRSVDAITRIAGK